MSENDHTVTDRELQDDERISAYLRARMTKDEETAFFEDLKSDEALRERAIAIAYLARALKDVGEHRDRNLREALLAIDENDVKRIVGESIGVQDKIDIFYDVLDKEEYQKEQEYQERRAQGSMALYSLAPPASAKRPRNVRLIIIRLASVAACLLVLVVAGYKYYDYHKVTSLGDKYAAVFVSQQQPSRGAENANAVRELSRLYGNVQRGQDLDSTIYRLSLLWELANMETYNDYTNEAPYIGWNLAIAHLKNNDKQAAIVVLSRLASSARINPEVRGEAEKLLEKLR